MFELSYIFVKQLKCVFGFLYTHVEIRDDGRQSMLGDLRHETE